MTQKLRNQQQHTAIIEKWCADTKLTIKHHVMNINTLLILANIAITIFSFIHFKKQLKKMTTNEQAAFTTLTADVTALTTGVNNLITQNNGYAAQLKTLAGASTDPDMTDQINALAAQITSDTANVQATLPTPAA